VIELHFHTFSGFGRVLKAEPFLSRAVEQRSKSGIPALVLAREDDVLYLALHAASHRFVRLGWLFDLKLLIQGTPPIGWADVLARARDLEIRSALALTLTVLKEKLDVAVPDGVVLDPSSVRARIAPLLLSPRVVRDPSSPITKLTSFALSTVFSDHPGHALRFAARKLSHVSRREVHRWAHAVTRARTRDVPPSRSGRSRLR
jgi:hypothetical protein